MPGAQRQLREVAQTLGISKEEFAELGMNAFELDRKLSQIKFPSSSEFASEDTRKLIANMSQLNEKTGKFEVQLYDEKLGHNITKSIDELKTGDIDKIEQAQKNASKTVEELQLEANGILKEVSNYLRMVLGKPATAVATSDVLQNKQDLVGLLGLPAVKTADELIFGPNGTVGLRDNINKLNTSLNGLITDVVTGTKTMDEALTVLGTMTTDYISKRKEDFDLEKIVGSYLENMSKTTEVHPELTKVTEDYGIDVTNIKPLEDGKISLNDGLIISGPKGSFQAHKDDIATLSPPTTETATTTEVSKQEITHNHQMSIEIKGDLQAALSGILYSNEFKNAFMKQMDEYISKSAK
jgi:hypothetical protein